MSITPRNYVVASQESDTNFYREILQPVNGIDDITIIALKNLILLLYSARHALIASIVIPSLAREGFKFNDFNELRLKTSTYRIIYETIYN